MPDVATKNAATGDRDLASSRRDKELFGSPILCVEDLVVANGEGAPIVKGVSFALRRGGTLGIVGESGSGKSIMLRSVLGLLPPGFSVQEGSIRLFDTEVVDIDDRAWRPLRGSRVAAIFQDPGSFLNPSIAVGKQLSEVLRVRKGLSRRQAKEEAIDRLAQLHLHYPERVYPQYPHELSGGMLQRVLLAIALSLDPDVLIADEATTALDVTVQADILELLEELKSTQELSLIVVSHDLAVVAQVAEEVLVIRDGRIVESGTTQKVLYEPEAEYTRLLVREHEQYGLDRFLGEKEVV